MGHLHWLHMKCYKTISFKESNTSHIVTAVIKNDSLAVYQKKRIYKDVSFNGEYKLLCCRITCMCLYVPSSVL